MKLVSADEMKEAQLESFGTCDPKKVYHMNYLEFVPTDIIDDVSTELFDSAFKDLEEEMTKDVQNNNLPINYLKFRTLLQNKLRIIVKRNLAVDQLLEGL